MKLTKKIIQSVHGHPAIVRFIEQRRKIKDIQEKAGAVEVTRQNLIAARNAALVKAQSLDLADVQALVDAQAKFDQYDKAVSPLVNAGVGWASDEFENSDEANDIVMDALNVVAAAVTAEADSVAADHQAKLTKIGLGGTYGPSPAEIDLRTKASGLQRRANAMSERDENTVARPWMYASLIDEI